MGMSKEFFCGLESKQCTMEKKPFLNRVGILITYLQRVIQKLNGQEAGQWEVHVWSCEQMVDSM